MELVLRGLGRSFRRFLDRRLSEWPLEDPTSIRDHGRIPPGPWEDSCKPLGEPLGRFLQAPGRSHGHSKSLRSCIRTLGTPEASHRTHRTPSRPLTARPGLRRGLSQDSPEAFHRGLPDGLPTRVLLSLLIGFSGFFGGLFREAIPDSFGRH